jgi:hypothetical protein
MNLNRSKGEKKMEKYKVHLIDLDNRSEVIKRLVINENQLKIFNILMENELFPDWLRVEILPDEIPYTDLT